MSGEPFDETRVDAILRRSIEFLSPIGAIYDIRFEQNGSTPPAVLWRDAEGQKLRFRILADMLRNEREPFSVNDLGCGYGALYAYLTQALKLPVSMYYGYDLSETMTDKADREYPGAKTFFTQSAVASHIADYSFVSGTYNLSNDTDDNQWFEYVRASLFDLWGKTRKGLAFNMLDERQRRANTGLYYASLDVYLDFCRKHLSQNVRVISDYPLVEWTIVITR